MTRGLVLGKFAPLHRGHQLLIECSLQENEETVLLIYDSPAVTPIPLSTRAGWIRRLYPSVRIVEGWDGPTEVGDSPEIKQRHEAYLHKVLKGIPIDRFYSSEFYGDHVSKALGAEDRRMDPDRSRFPVSGTAVREDPYRFRKYLDPIVYRDLVIKVVFLGAPSSGKTTLARTLAERYKTVWMPEYGREYWEQHQQNRRLTPEQLVEIAEGHREREEALFQQARNIIFIDTDATTTCMFARDYHGHALPRLEELAAQTHDRYDHFFLCEPDIPYHDTWDRDGDEHRQRFHQQIVEDLNARNIPFTPLRGSVAQRIKKVEMSLNYFNKAPSSCSS